MQSAISLIWEPTCDLLIKRDLRPVFPNEAQQLLALRLQVPPVAATHQAKEGFVRPLQCLNSTWALSHALGTSRLHCNIYALHCTAWTAWLCMQISTLFQTQSSILLWKGQEGVGGEGSETPPCLERTPPPLTVCSQARMALCRRICLLVQACPGQESAVPRQTCASHSKNPPLQAFDTPGKEASISGDSSGQHYCPEGRI